MQLVLPGDKVGMLREGSASGTCTAMKTFAWKNCSQRKTAFSKPLLAMTHNYISKSSLSAF